MTIIATTLILAALINSAINDLRHEGISQRLTSQS